MINLLLLKETIITMSFNIIKSIDECNTTEFMPIYPISVYNQISSKLRVRCCSNNSGTLSVFSKAPHATQPNDYVTVTYQVSYSKTFAHPPQFALGIHSMNNCPTNFQHYSLAFHQLLTNTASYLRFNSSVFIAYEYDPNYDLTLKYLAVDAVVYPNFQFQYKMIDSQQQTTTTSVYFTNTGINDQNTFKAAYIMSLYCLIPFNLFQAIITGNPQAANNFLVSMSVPNTNTAGVCGKYIHKICAVLIKPDPSIIIRFGVIDTQAIAMTSQPMSLDNLEPSSRFFIGLTRIVSNDQCIKIALSNKQTGLNASESEVTIAVYKYIQVMDASKIEVKYYFWENRVEFNFDYELMQYNSGSFNQTLKAETITTKHILARYNSTRITETPTTIVVTGSTAADKYRLCSVFYIKSIEIMVVKVLQNVVDLYLFNFRKLQTSNDLKVNDSRAILNSITYLQPYLNYSFRHNGDIFETQMELNHDDPDGGYKTTIFFQVPTITSIEVSVKDHESRLKLRYIPFRNGATYQRIELDSVNVLNQTFTNKHSSIECKFKYKKQIIGEELKVEFVALAVTEFKVHFVFKLFLLTAIELYSNSSIFKLNLTNTLRSDIELSHMNCSNCPTFSSLQIVDDTIVLTGDSSNSSDSQFDLEYEPPNSDFKFRIKELKIKSLFNSTTADHQQNTITFVFNNADSVDESNLPSILSNIGYIIVDNVTLEDDQIIILCSYTSTVADNQITFTYDVDTQTLVKQYITIPLQFQYPLVYCQFGKEKQRNQLFLMVSYALDGLYIAVFVLSMASCRKMYGVELMYLIQLAYYSLIPINLLCRPLKGLAGLRYSIGYIPILDNLHQQTILSNYTNIGIKSNFLSNVNVLIILVLICPLLSIPLTIKGNKSIDPKSRPRLLKYGKSLMLQIPLTILLFDSFNVYSSFVINFQSLGASDPISLVASILCILLLPVYVLLFIRFNAHFVQFRSEFNQIDSAYRLQRKTVIKIRRMYPLILMIEMVIVPLVLTIDTLFKYGLYIVLGIELVITLYTALFPLYLLRIANIRNYIHRGIVILICIIQIIILKFKDSESFASIVQTLLPFGLLFILLLGLGTTGAFIVYKSMEFWKSPNLIDCKLLIQQHGKNKPVDVTPLPLRQSPRWMPRSIHILKLMQKQRIREPLRNNQFQQEYVLSSQKLQRWFAEIETDNLFSQLGINKIAYLQLKNSNPGWYRKEKFVRDILNYVDVEDVLCYKSTTVVTLKDLIEDVGDEKLRQIQNMNRNIFYQI